MKLKDNAKETNIKEATLQLVAKEGIAGIKMNKVAKLAGVAPSVIYTYFKNKEDLLFQIFIDCLDCMNFDLAEYSQEKLVYKVKLLKIFKRIIALKVNKSMEYNFLKQFEISPYYKPEHHQFMMKNVGNKTVALFEEGQKNMILKESNNPLLMAILFDAVSNKLATLHQIPLENTLIDEAFSLIWSGFRD